MWPPIRGATDSVPATGPEEGDWETGGLKGGALLQARATETPATACLIGGRAGWMSRVGGKGGKGGEKGC